MVVAGLSQIIGVGGSLRAVITVQVQSRYCSAKGKHEVLRRTNEFEDLYKQQRRINFRELQKIILHPPLHTRDLELGISLSISCWNSLIAISFSGVNSKLQEPPVNGTTAGFLVWQVRHKQVLIF